MNEVIRISEIDFLNKKLAYPLNLYSLRPTVYGIIYDADDRIAAIHYKDFTRHPFPGGGVLETESNTQALEREILEEIGCKITNTKLIGIFDSWSDENKTYYPTYLFTARIFGQKGIPTTDEKYEIESTVLWRPLSEIFDELANDNCSMMIKEIIKRSELL